MKKHQNKRISLKKITITRINLNTMRMVKGGECDVTDIDTDTGSHETHCVCQSGREVF
ncbi:class I lanthipeptide [Aquimarina macrocephali]|uniref:class I lanthipeptide n=1 Tax=Aquimarina macrocephali TaxID=666563 RepID=UPI0004AF0763|nr:class I lanthipeptide [Aquimarina macrocephali]